MHYFGTYPYAENKPGESPFTALPNTPSVNGLSNSLLTANPNTDEPQRLAPTQALTCDQNHGYTAEQSAFDMGLMDKFVQDTTGGGCSQTTYPDSGSYRPNGIVMDYYDGNTVTALWNLAQHFTLNDESYSTQFGPSSPGAINLISGNTNPTTVHSGTRGAGSRAGSRPRSPSTAERSAARSPMRPAPTTCWASTTTSATHRRPGHTARFTVRKQLHKGSYKVRVTVDAAGHVGAQTRTLGVR